MSLFGLDLFKVKLELNFYELTLNYSQVTQLICTLYVNHDKGDNTANVESGMEHMDANEATNDVVDIRVNYTKNEKKKVFTIKGKVIVEKIYF